MDPNRRDQTRVGMTMIELPSPGVLMLKINLPFSTNSLLETMYSTVLYAQYDRYRVPIPDLYGSSRAKHSEIFVDTSIELG